MASKQQVRCAVHDAIFETENPQLYSGEPDSDCPQCASASLNDTTQQGSAVADRVSEENLPVLSRFIRHLRGK